MKTFTITSMNEKEFLESLKKEIDTAHYGEGVSFNLTQISRMIAERIKSLKVNKPDHE